MNWYSEHAWQRNSSTADSVSDNESHKERQMRRETATIRPMSVCESKRREERREAIMVGNLIYAAWRGNDNKQHMTRRARP